MSELSQATFRKIADLMHATVGLSLNDSKRALVSSRLAHRMQRLGIARHDDYLALISRDRGGEEFQVAVDLLTTHETYFFREPEHFEVLRRELGQRRPQQLRLWSAASSFGDEAFSLAMTLAELQRNGVVGDDWSILGTDISDRVLRSACEGIFPAERLRHVSPQQLKQFCLRGEGVYEGFSMMQPRLRERVRFGQLNLCLPMDPIGPFDIIFLRNVLIYFDPPTKQQVVDRVLSQLRVGGLLFIGMAEGRANSQTPLEPVSAGVFRKLAPHSPP